MSHLSWHPLVFARAFCDIEVMPLDLMDHWKSDVGVALIRAGVNQRRIGRGADETWTAVRDDGRVLAFGPSNEPGKFQMTTYTIDDLAGWSRQWGDVAQMARWVKLWQERDVEII